jgi:hypothetical protein
MLALARVVEVGRVLVALLVAAHDPGETRDPADRLVDRRDGHVVELAGDRDRLPPRARRLELREQLVQVWVLPHQPHEPAERRIEDRMVLDDRLDALAERDEPRADVHRLGMALREHGLARVADLEELLAPAAFGPGDALVGDGTGLVSPEVALQAGCRADVAEAGRRARRSAGRSRSRSSSSARTGPRRCAKGCRRGRGPAGSGRRRAPRSPPR